MSEAERAAVALLGEPLVDAATVAAFLGCDKATVYRLAASTALASVEIAPRVVRFRPADVREFVERRTRRPAPRPRVKQLLAPRYAHPGPAERN